MGRTTCALRGTVAAGLLLLCLPSAEAKSPRERSWLHTKQVDLASLPEKFKQAERDYVAASGQQVTNGTTDVSSWRFLRDHLQPYDTESSKFRTGKEAALMAKVRALATQRYKNNGPRIQPEDLYRLSLEVNGGDRLKALTTVHDALKDTGRGYQTGAGHSEKTMRGLVGDRFFDRHLNGQKWTPKKSNAMGEAFLRRVLAPIGNETDQTGKYYHMFGTASGSLIGGWGRVSPRIHAHMVNNKTVMDKLEKQTRDYYGDNMFGSFMAAASRPVGAIASGLGSWGEYTIVHKDKWSADKTGVDIGKALADTTPPEPKTNGLPGAPVVSDYAKRLMNKGTPDASGKKTATKQTEAKQQPVAKQKKAGEKDGVVQALEGSMR